MKIPFSASGASGASIFKKVAFFMVKTINKETTRSLAYQQALEDFGITHLISYLQNYSDADFSAASMSLEEQELESLAALLVQHLLNNLKGKLIASYLHAIRYGDSDVRSHPTDLEISLPSDELPTNFAQQIIPRYQEGDRVRWQPLISYPVDLHFGEKKAEGRGQKAEGKEESCKLEGYDITHMTDWGTVIGHFYAYASHLGQWSIYYLIRLAANSPSCTWTVTDIAWEDDLEPNSDKGANSTLDHRKIPNNGTQSNSDSTLATNFLVSPLSPIQTKNTSSPTKSLPYPLLQRYLHTPPGSYRYGGITERTLTKREQEIIKLYSYCQLGMTPQRFYAKWAVNQDRIAMICSRSISTVRRWFSRGRNYRRPMSNDLRHLAIMDFLLEHFEEIPQEFRNLLNC